MINIDTNTIPEVLHETKIKEVLLQIEHCFFSSCTEMERDVYEVRIKSPSKKNLTFEEIGNCYGVSRQRIDQVDKRTKIKLKKYFNKFYNIEEYLSNSEIDIIDHKIINNEYLFLFKICVEPNIFIDVDTSLIFKDKNKFYNLSNMIVKEFKESIPYYDSCISDSIKEAFLKEYKSFPQNKLANIILSIKENLCKKSFISLEPLESNKYLLDTKNKHVNKDIKLEYFFKILYPEGIHLPQKKTDLFEQNIEILRTAMPEEKAVSRRLYQKLVGHPKVIASNFGEFIHVDNLNYDKQIVEEIINRCIYLFSQGINVFNTKNLFEIFKNELISKGIKNHLMLHSLLKYQNSDKIKLHKGNNTQIINPIIEDTKISIIDINNFANSKYHSINEQYPEAESNFNIICDENDKRRIKNTINEYSLETKEATPTERDQIVKQRLTQGEFRQGLINNYKGCKLCGLDEPNLLIASHIKPWKDSTDIEKQDIDNGFLLCAWHDALFDKGYISFEDDGSLLLSSQFKNNKINLMDISEHTRIKISENNKKYLKFHRENCFLDNRAKS